MSTKKMVQKSDVRKLNQLNAQITIGFLNHGR